MSRRYIDFWINIDEDTEIQKMLSRIRELGFSSIAVSMKYEDVFENIRKLGKEFKIDVYRKIVLEPDDRESLLKGLRNYRGRYEVVSVICNNLEIALTSARDGRVDTLIIPPSKKFRVDKGVAATIKNCIEIPFKWFIDRALRRDLIRTLYEIVDYLAGKVDLILSSSASKPSELRSPYEMASLLSVLGFDKKYTLDSVSSIPMKIIESNLVKLSPDYISRGVVKIA